MYTAVIIIFVYLPYRWYTASIYSYMHTEKQFTLYLERLSVYASGSQTACGPWTGAGQRRTGHRSAEEFHEFINKF